MSHTETTEAVIQNICDGVTEYPHGRLALAVDLREQLRAFATTIRKETLEEMERGIPEEQDELIENAYGKSVDRRAHAANKVIRHMKAHLQALKK
jgi:hypothetical protein